MPLETLRPPPDALRNAKQILGSATGPGTVAPINVSDSGRLRTAEAGRGDVGQEHDLLVLSSSGISGRFDPTPLITHRLSLDDIVEAYDFFGSRRDGVLKVAITP